MKVRLIYSVNFSNKNITKRDNRTQKQIIEDDK